jgi:hypothetical protein
MEGDVGRVVITICRPGVDNGDRSDVKGAVIVGWDQGVWGFLR